jgi:hypothetical protein
MRGHRKFGSALVAAALCGLISTPATAGVRACSSGWTVVPSPQGGAKYNQLFAVAAVAADDVWAVGGSKTHFRTLTEHWDGASWTVVPSPSSGFSDFFSGVDSDPAGDVWAVGARNTYGSMLITLTDHWDGSSWVEVPSPNEPDQSPLEDVAVLSSTDVWAVGRGHGTMAIHWDGGSWTNVHTPDPASLTSEFKGVAAASSSDVWAVGDAAQDASHIRTLIEHWDGSRWAIVPSPGRPGVPNALEGVEVVSSTDVWAVGHSGMATEWSTLVEHWDGSQWTIVPSPTRGSGYLEGVAAVSASNVWAAGWGYRNGKERTLIERWDGSAWTMVMSPNPSSILNELRGITALPSGELWNAGAFVSSSEKTLVESACFS